MSERQISINPEKRDDYLNILDQKFHQWHQEEWEIVYPYEYFRNNIASQSFLAMVDRVVRASSPEGTIDLTELEGLLKEELGEYFSPERLEKAVYFVENDEWKHLR